ncbi:hypothetical protein BJX70DRAFT_371190 [Aspergillus crustosus]
MMLCVVSSHHFYHPDRESKVKLIPCSQLIHLNYTGVVTLGDAECAVLTGTAEDGSTAWGNSFTHVTFETGHERYKELENRVFVGKGRFTAENGKAPAVEYRVGQVVHA